jgi:hypothetical protein
VLNLGSLSARHVCYPYSRSCSINTARPAPPSAQVMDGAGKHQILIFVHSRKETAKTARYLKETALANEQLTKLVRDDSASKEILQVGVGGAAVRTSCAYHNWGLCASHTNMPSTLASRPEWRGQVLHGGCCCVPAALMLSACCHAHMPTALMLSACCPAHMTATLMLSSCVTRTPG